MSEPSTPPTNISVHELDLLRSAAGKLPPAQDPPAEYILLGQLIRAERQNWPQLEIT